MDISVTARSLLARRMRSVSSRTAHLFHRLWYDTGVWHDVAWQGVRVLKNPMDLWMYQEIVSEVEPDLIVETGTFSGGSALYFAHLLDIQGKGIVVTVDVDSNPSVPVHPRIRYLTGSSTSPEIVEQLKSLAAKFDRVMVVLDSDHSREHVADELRLLSPLVTVGSYLIVEDTNVNGHPVHRRFGPGPMEALREFMASTTAFERDERRERFLFTFNPEGWLVRTCSPDLAEPPVNPSG